MMHQVFSDDIVPIRIVVQVFSGAPRTAARLWIFPRTREKERLNYSFRPIAFSAWRPAAITSSLIMQIRRDERHTETTLCYSHLICILIWNIFSCVCVCVCVLSAHMAALCVAGGRPPLGAGTKTKEALSLLSERRRLHGPSTQRLPADCTAVTHTAHCTA